MKKKIKKNLENFLLSNKLIRTVRIFINQKLRPLLFRVFAVLSIIAIFIIIALQIFNPSYLKKKYQKISFEILRHINFDSKNLKNINIYGNNRTSNEEILKVVKKAQDSYNYNADNNYKPLIQNLTSEIKKQLPWVSSVVVTRNIPDKITITVEEYEPFAIWEHKGNKYVADKDGNTVLVDDIEEFENLIIISGDEANIHVNSLFNIFAIDPKLSAEVYSATWLGGRRWDIRLNSGLLIKLPESNIGDAWNKLIKIYNMQGSLLELKVIDLRIDGNIYLEYGDSIVKEIQSL